MVFPFSFPSLARFYRTTPVFLELWVVLPLSGVFSRPGKLILPFFTPSLSPFPPFRLLGFGFGLTHLVTLLAVYEEGLNGFPNRPRPGSLVFFCVCLFWSRSGRSRYLFEVHSPP